MLNRSTCITTLILFLAPVQGAANNGTLRGRAQLSGPVPPRHELTAHHDPSVCGNAAPLRSEAIVASADGGLANVVVIVSGVPGAGAAPAPALLQQRNCTFLPHVQSVRVGSTLTITNDDPVLHNVHAYIHDRSIFNLAMPVKGVRIERKLKEAGIIAMRCDSGHTWMSAYIAVVPHSYHATTDASGAFEIAGLPPGTYTVSAWHERLGTQETSVTIEAGAAATAAFTFAAPVAPEDSEEQAGHAAMADVVTPDFVDEKITAVEDALYDEVDALRDGLAATRKALRAEERRRIAGDARPLFLRHCATCHGRDGDGTGPSARYLDIPPRDFTRGEYQFRMTPSGTLAREADIYRTITVGILGTPMPPWGKILTEAQRWLLTRYLMTLSPRFLDETSGEPIEIAPEPENNAASITRGKEVYVQMKCAQCHGESGRGDGTSADTTKDDWGNPIKPYDFTVGYFQGGRGGAVVYRAMSTGLSGTPMPSYADVLPVEDRWHLAHFILSLGEPRGFLDYLFGDAAGRISTP